MIDAGIRDGDIVVVSPRKDAPANGTIVVARIENEHTGEERGDRQAILPRDRTDPPAAENSTMEPIYARELELEAWVVAVIRLLK